MVAVAFFLREGGEEESTGGFVTSIIVGFAVAADEDTEKVYSSVGSSVIILGFSCGCVVLVVSSPAVGDSVIGVPTGNSVGGRLAATGDGDGLFLLEGSTVGSNDTGNSVGSNDGALVGLGVGGRLDKEGDGLTVDGGCVGR